MMLLDKHLRFYHEQRLSTIPIPYSKKEANIKWQVYQKRLPTDAEIDMWFSNNQSNLAIVCGEVSGNLVVVDCDNDEKFLELKPIIESKLGIDNLINHTPVVKTGKGYHIYFRTKEPVMSQKFPRLDIKSEGGYVIAPPSIHPNGTQYKFINENVPSIMVIHSLEDIGIPVNQKPELPRNQPNWVTQALQGVSEGQRNDICMRLAGYFKNKHPQDITENLLLNWNSKNKPPLPEKEILTTISSVYRYDGSCTNADNNTLSLYASTKQNLASKRDNFETTSGQDWGIYAKKFDDLMRESGGGIDKREVAETIGLKATSDTFRKLLNRRKSEGKVRPYRGSPYLIEWVNKDYTVTRLDKMKAHSMLDIYLPLKIHEYAGVPPGSVIGIAGMTSSGKTSFLLEMAELNVLTQPLAVYYWYNEMSEAKMIYRCEDFPLLLQAQKADKFFPVKQGNFEFADVLQADAINLIDYIDRDEDVFLIGGDIKKLYSQLNNGVVIFALQKKAHLDLGYGGNMSIKLSNLYITLDTKYQSGKSMHGMAKIVKCKDWKNIDVNPSGLYCEYHTGGMHGKLFLDGEWKRSNK
jgi:hypothetical protein